MLEVTEQIQMIFLFPVFIQLCREILTEKQEFFFNFFNNIIL